MAGAIAVRRSEDYFYMEVEFRSRFSVSSEQIHDRRDNLSPNVPSVVWINVECERNDDVPKQQLAPPSICEVLSVQHIRSQQHRPFEII